MYQYTEFDHQFVRARAAQHRDQLERFQAGQLSADEFKPLRLQNGWYVQRYAPMLRVAVPYGELSSAQLRVLATIARDYDQPQAQVYQTASLAQSKLGTAHLPTGYAHFTTRQNAQFNWIPLTKSADVMDLLASVDMHGIQTSGNCIRNITATNAPALQWTRSSTRGRFARSCDSGAPCTLNLPFCRASSRSR